MTSKVMLSFTPRKRVACDLDCGDERRTKQAFKAECDINNIIGRYKETGQLPQALSQPQYGVAPDLDLKSAIDTLNAFKEEFSELPQHVHDMFSNDPYVFAQFLNEYEQNPEKFYFADDRKKSENFDAPKGGENVSDNGSKEPKEKSSKDST